MSSMHFFSGLWTTRHAACCLHLKGSACDWNNGRVLGASAEAGGANGMLSRVEMPTSDRRLIAGYFCADPFPFWFPKWWRQLLEVECGLSRTTQRLYLVLRRQPTRSSRSPRSCRGKL